MMVPDPDADQDPVQAMSRVKPYLLDAAQRYRDRHDGRPPVRTVLTRTRQCSCISHTSTLIRS